MSSCARILYNTDIFDAATITASTYIGDLTAANIVNDLLGWAWRSTSTTAWVKFNLGQARLLTQVSLFGCNFTALAYVYVQANATDVWTSPSYSAAVPVVVNSDGVALRQLTLFLSQTYQWWRISITDTTNTAGYLQIGRVKAGQFYEFPRNMSDGFGITKTDPSEGIERPGTLTQWRQRTPYRRAELSFAHLGATQAAKMNAIVDKVGRHKPLVLCLDPDADPTGLSLYCRLTSPLYTVYELVNVYTQGNLVFEEITE